MRFATQRVFDLIAGIWVGGFITVGFLVVPMLFSALDDRQVAGMVAGRLIHAETYMSIALNLILLILGFRLDQAQGSMSRRIRWILIAMLACSLAAAFIFLPWMSSLKDQATLNGVSVTETSQAVLFARLHQVSSLVYFLQSLLGLSLVWYSTKR